MQEIKTLAQKMRSLERDLKQKMKTLPRILGTESVRMARQQIDRGGTIDNGFKPWPARVQVTRMATQTVLRKNAEGQMVASHSKIRFTDQGRNANKKQLFNRGNLYRAITFTVSGEQVSVGVDLATIPYAQIHNEGGQIPITYKMRVFFMAKFRETGNPFYLGMAKHKGNTITMPKRQFLAITPELINSIEKAVYTYILEPALTQ